ncbi:transcription elongation factor GreB [Acetobacteraceae bacterium KSS8]|uniref:Transcription elongation factor GreB n=1 Tax=Endosaccharibacter trunci TaxID=2812733 RepID=A0ABT1W4J6_9PROT|nr:transcription elongation factor GreB [Acetobacteraceae bacterium KSS8]
MDEDDEDVPLPGRLSGINQYVTRAGLERMEAELRHLLRVERPGVVDIVSWAAGNGDRSENGDYLYGKKRLREIDRRIRFLEKRIDKALVVDPASQPHRDRVFFGATVTFVDDDDVSRTVTIVGVDEADMERGEISLASPVARALLGARVGDEVVLRVPGKTNVLEVTAIVYP